MTWFDALLITLLGMLSALGLRLGLGGLVWSGLCLLAAALVNVLSVAMELWAAVLLALILGAVATVVARLVQGMVVRPYYAPSLWASAAGLLGGTALGAAVAAAFALAFPLSPWVDAAGVRYLYPSLELAPALHQAVDDSLFKHILMPLWEQPSALQSLLLPDLPGLKRAWQP